LAGTAKLKPFQQEYLTALGVTTHSHRRQKNAQSLLIKGAECTTYDQIDLENRLDLSEEIHREYLIEGIKSRDGQAGVVSFDDTNSLIVSGPDKSIKQDIRIFMERLMEINILQVWTCPDSKGSSPLPDDLFDFVFRVAPEQDSDSISFSVTCERNAYLGQMKFPPVNLELSQDEGGKLRMVDRGLVRSERNAAILLAVNGQTQAQIGQSLGRDQSTVSLWLKKAKENGLINRDGNNYILTTKGRKALTS
jgi:hypothetical protein